MVVALGNERERTRVTENGSCLGGFVCSRYTAVKYSFLGPFIPKISAYTSGPSTMFGQDGWTPRGPSRGISTLLARRPHYPYSRHIRSRCIEHKLSLYTYIPTTIPSA